MREKLDFAYVCKSPAILQQLLVDRFAKQVESRRPARAFTIASRKRYGGRRKEAEQCGGRRMMGLLRTIRLDRVRPLHEHDLLQVGLHSHMTSRTTAGARPARRPAMMRQISGDRRYFRCIRRHCVEAAVEARKTQFETARPDRII